MMTSVGRSASLLLLAASAAACGDPAGPRPASVPPNDPQLSASVERGSGVYAPSGPVYLDCIGETVDHWASIPYTFTSVTTPKGETVFSDHFLHSGATGSMWGLTSGTVWTLERVISPEVIIATSGTSYRFTSTIFWVSTTGPTIQLHGQYVFVQNASGEIVVDKTASKAGCTLH